MNKSEIVQQLVGVGSLPAPEPVEFNGKTFYVRRLNGKGRAALQRRQKELHDAGQKYLSEADLAALGLCLKSGEPVFPDVAEGVELFAQLDGELQGAIALKFLAVNALTQDAGEKK